MHFLLQYSLWLCLVVSTTHLQAQHKMAALPPSDITQMEEIIAFYDFTKGSFKNYVQEQKNAPKQGNTLFKNETLYVGGEYKGYDTEFYLGEYGANNSKDFTISWNFKPEDFTFYNTTNLLAFSQYSRWLKIGRNRNEGYLVVDFRNGEYYQEFKNTLIEKDKWYNITLMFMPQQRKAVVYLNGKKLNELNIGDFSKDESKENISFSFCGYGNGSVFQGYAQKLAFFEKALNDKEFRVLYKKMIQDIPTIMPTAVNDVMVESYEEFSYEVAKEWEYTPSCVEGDQLRDVTVTCKGGRKVKFGIAYWDSLQGGF